MAYLSAELQLRFLSTLSLRRATLYVIIVSLSDNDFYPRSPCGERPYCIITKSCYNNFYPRSPCGERRKFGFTHTAQELFLSTLSLRRATDLFHVCTSLVVFLSTLSLRRATRRNLQGPAGRHISIHALLAESDIRK